jgi:hypothetical protein
MSSEFEDTEPGLQRDSQPAAPTAPNAAPAGGPLEAPPPAATLANLAALAPARAAGPPPAKPPWQRSADGPEIQTDTKPIRTCPKCNIALPIDAGSGGQCGQFVPGHKRVRKRLKKTDVDALIAKAKADYQPATTIEHHACENLGLTLAELKATRPGSPDHQRLLGAVQTITAILEASRASSETRTQTDLDALDDDQLIERASAILRQLLESRDAQRKGQAHIAAASEDINETTASEPATTPAPQPEPVCQYCRRKCVGSEHPAFEVLHWSDPEEQKKRDDAATAVMMKQFGKPLPDWYR